LSISIITFLVRDFWRDSLFIFLPKIDGKGVRPIALLSCFLKILERMIYRRLQWAVESYFIFPEFQYGFRSSRSCTDNLVILTARIHSFLCEAFTAAVFLDIASAFDNVIPSILIQDLRDIGFPAQICKFIKNLLTERHIYYTQCRDLIDPLIRHKGHKTPQDSILNPFLFNIYLRNIGSCLYSDTQILQYADDIVLFSSGTFIAEARNSLSLSLRSINDFLKHRGLDLAPTKSKYVLFTRRRKIEEVQTNPNSRGRNFGN